MNSHWLEHEKKYPVDREKDPKGLVNACIPTAPAWLNDYHDRIQKKVFRQLLTYIHPASSVLDIGCGSGRWIDFMREHGIKDLTGVDIQKSLIDENRKRMPGIRWIAGDFREQSYGSELFDLITSVTVLQHILPSEIIPTLRFLHRNLKTGGHMIALENISYISNTCFGWRPIQWKELFHSGGFKIVRAIPYDSGLFLQAVDHHGLRWLGRYFRHLDLIFDFPAYSRHFGFLLEAI